MAYEVYIYQRNIDFWIKIMFDCLVLTYKSKIIRSILYTLIYYYVWLMRFVFGINSNSLRMLIWIRVKCSWKVQVGNTPICSSPSRIHAYCSVLRWLMEVLCFQGRAVLISLSLVESLSHRNLVVWVSNNVRSAPSAVNRTKYFCFMR